MALDSFDRELLRRMDLHGYYCPNSVDERLRLVKLAELGLVQSKLQYTTMPREASRRPAID